jgi:GDSL-like lipase/acylhydrolase family protein
MRKLLILIGCLVGWIAQGQTIQRLGGTTTQIYIPGQLRVDSIVYLPYRDTTFTPAQIGAVVVKSSNNLLYMWGGTRWLTIPLGSIAWGTITGLIANQTDLTTYLSTNYQPVLTQGYGIDIASNTVIFDSAHVRKVDTVERVNDSTLEFTINGAPHNVLLRGTAAGGINSLSMAAPSTLFGTPVNFSNTGGAWTGSLLLNTASPGTFLAGPVTGSAAAPTMRAITTTDLPTGIPNGNLANSLINVTLGTSGTTPAWASSSVSLGSTLTLNLPFAGPSSSGPLTSSDWNRFNTGISSLVTSVNGQSGIVVAKNADSLLSYPLDFSSLHNGYVLGYDSVTGTFGLQSGLPQTWQQTLSTGRTFANADSVLLNGYSFYLKGGLTMAESVHIGVAGGYSPLDSIIGYGDSHMWGELSDNTTQSVVVDTAKRWFTIAARNLGLIPIDNGVPGATLVSNFVDNIPTFPYFSVHTKWMIVEFGTNDLYQSVDSNTFKANYIAALDSLVLNRGWPANRIVLVTPYLFFSGYAPLVTDWGILVKEIAAIVGCQVFDAYTLINNYGGVSNSPDGIHVADDAHYLEGMTLAKMLSDSIRHNGQPLAANGLVDFQNLQLTNLDSADNNTMPVGIDQYLHLKRFRRNAWAALSLPDPQIGNIKLQGNINSTNITAQLGYFTGGTISPPGPSVGIGYDAINDWGTIFARDTNSGGVAKTLYIQPFGGAITLGGNTTCGANVQAQNFVAIGAIDPTGPNPSLYGYYSQGNFGGLMTYGPHDLVFNEYGGDVIIGGNSNNIDPSIGSQQFQVLRNSIFGDTVACVARISYTTNLGSSLGIRSVPDKGYVDSSLAVGGLKAHNDLTAQTTAVSTVTSYAVPGSGSFNTFSVGGYITITALSLDVIQLQVGWTDETSTSRTQSFFVQGATTGIGATGAYAYSPVTIRAKQGTTITVATILTTGSGSITYDVGGNITRLY